MDARSRIVIVGGGLAGAESARALRAQGFAGTIVLLAAEAHEPYDRPPLTKSVLLAGVTGGVGLPRLDLDWEALDVDLRLATPAVALHQGSVITPSGPVEYDGLVLAVGSVPRRPKTALSDPEVTTFRTWEDALALRALLRPGTRLVLVGAGWIGAELATAAASAGCQVTVLEALAEPLSAVLPPSIAARTRGWWSGAGVDLRTGRLAVGGGHGQVLLDDGEVLPADVVVAGVGARPATDWLRGSHLVLDPDGAVVVDDRLCASDPAVVAVGDCARWPSRRYGRPLRVEHWDNALRGPAVAAGTLLGAGEAHDPVPYFWSEQFGRMLQVVGLPEVADHWVRRDEGTTWSEFGLCGNRLVALVAADRRREAAQTRRLLERADVSVASEDLLADPAVGVRDLAA